MPACFLDFEASSLSDRSYPIEVAWSRPDGSIEQRLINPAGVSQWTEWNTKAAELHGIRRQELREQGETPRAVAAALNADLAGQIVHCDAPDYDGFWLERLFAASFGLRPAFTLASSFQRLLQSLHDAGVPDAEVRFRLSELQFEASTRHPHTHRAAADVAHMLELDRLAREWTPAR